MNLVFKPSYGNLKTFFHIVSDTIESISVGNYDKATIEENISDIAYIIYKNTGINLICKDVGYGSRTILEANNLRALESMLFIASRTHELNNKQVLSGDISYREIYQNEIRELLDKMGLTDLTVTHSWVCIENEDTMYDYISFNMDSVKLDHCMNRINRFIKEDML